MTRHSSGTPGPTPGSPSVPLAERVRNRVSADGPAHEARAMRRLYREMGRTHRAYRHRTGAKVTPALADTARAFREERTLPALVGLAEHLDALGILDW